MDETKTIEKFLNKIIDYQNKQQTHGLQEDELKRIATDMGLTENDWQAIQKSFNESILRAKSYMQYKNYNDAILEIQQALPLNPYNLDAVFLLATLHKKKWDSQHSKDDKQKALDYANKCLQINPTYQKALQLISEIKTRHLKSSPRKHVNNTTLLLIVGIIVLVGMAVLFMLKKNAPQEDIKQNIQKEVETVSTDAIVFDKFDVPVVFKQNKKSKHLAIEIQNSNFNDYQNSYSYKLSTDIFAKGAEISSLVLRVEIVKSNGEILLSELVTALYENEPMARNGDIISFQFLKYVKGKKLPKLSKVLFYIEEIQENTDIPESYEAAKKIEFEWKDSRPANYNVEISERFTDYTSGIEKNKCFAKHIFEVKNTGNQPIELLKVEIVWYDKQNKEISRNFTYLNSASKVKIKRKQTHISSGTWTVNADKEQISKYKIIVQEIK